jgi:hypothetical protein
MHASHARIRIAAIAGAVLAVAPFALLIAHQLRDAKPYKIVGPPLHDALAFAGVWAPLFMVLIAVVVSGLIPRRRAALAPVAALAAAMLVSIGSVVLLTAAFGRTIPASGDFGTDAVIGEFLVLTLWSAVPSFAVAALLGWIVRRFGRV